MGVVRVAVVDVDGVVVVVDADVAAAGVVLVSVVGVGSVRRLGFRTEQRDRTTARLASRRAPIDASAPVHPPLRRRTDRPFSCGSSNVPHSINPALGTIRRRYRSADLAHTPDTWNAPEREHRSSAPERSAVAPWGLSTNAASASRRPLTRDSRRRLVTGPIVDSVGYGTQLARVTRTRPSSWANTLPPLASGRSWSTPWRRGFGVVVED